MIKIGALCKRIHGSSLCQVVSLYDRRDIDFECPESVAIVGMVKFIYLTGEAQGKTFKTKRSDFNSRWEVVNDA